MKRHQRQNKLVLWLDSFGRELAHELIRAGSLKNRARMLAWLAIKLKRAELLISRIERVIELRLFRPALMGLVSIVPIQAII
jgi:hypothetical protein